MAHARLERTMTGHAGPVYCVKFNTQGAYCMSCGADNTVRLWNPHRESETGNGALLIKTYQGMHSKGALDLDITTDNSRFASCGNDRTVYVWDVATANTIRKFWEHEKRVNTVKFNKDASVLVTGSYDTKIRVFDLKSRSPRPIQTITGFKDSVSAVTVTGHEIIGCSIDGSIRKYDVRAGKVICDTFPNAVVSFALSNDGNCVLAACLDSTLHLVEAKTGDLFLSYRGHINTSYKIGCCFSNTDAHVLCGSEDSIIRVWDLVEGTVVSTLKGHTQTVSSLAYHPKIQGTLVSASYDGTVKLWSA